jgi:hypothetical protein
MIIYIIPDERTCQKAIIILFTTALSANVYQHQWKEMDVFAQTYMVWFQSFQNASPVQFLGQLADHLGISRILHSENHCRKQPAITLAHSFKPHTLWQPKCITPPQNFILHFTNMWSNFCVISASTTVNRFEHYVRYFSGCNRQKIWYRKFFKHKVPY